MFRHTPLRTALATILFLAAIVYGLTADFFGLEILAEVAIIAMLAMSLDFLAGFGGMISLGHAAFYGVGAYVYAVLTTWYEWPPLVAMAAAFVVCGGAGWLVGFATARAKGIFFIMATLAFGQMAYVFLFESAELGGDDGMSGIPRLDLSAIGIDLNDSASFALFLVALAAGVYLLLAGLLSSGFGRTLVGVHRNEERMRAFGLPVRYFKAQAFAIAGAIAGLVGTLGAQHSMFVSPDMLSWTLSGELLIIVILGGLETLIGPALGAAAVIFLKHEISAVTVHWHIFLGLFLILAVVAGGRGLYGLIESAIGWVRGTRTPAPDGLDKELRDDA